MKLNRIALICIVAMLVFGALIYDRLPEQVPIHWNAAGQPDNTTSPLLAVLTMPIITAVLAAILPLARRIDPKREAFAEFEDVYRLFINLMIALMTYFHFVMLLSAAGWNIVVPQAVMVGVALLLILLGNVTGRIRPNWTFGIRTPWTLSDPEVWRKTHRMGGRLLVLSGLLMLIALLVLPLEWVAIVVIAILVGMAGALYFYSYRAWVQSNLVNKS